MATKYVTINLANGDKRLTETPTVAYKKEGRLLVSTENLQDPRTLIFNDRLSRVVEYRSQYGTGVVPPVPVADIVGFQSDAVGVTARWKASTVLSTAGYVVEMNYKDPENENLWTRQHGRLLPVTARSWTYKMLDDGQEVFIRVRAVNSVGSIIETVVEGSITQAQRAIKGPISKWSADVSKLESWFNPTSFVIKGEPGNQTVTFLRSDQTLQQVVPTYNQTGREYDIYVNVSCAPSEIGKTIQVYCHDNNPSGPLWSTVMTLTGPDQVFRVTRPVQVGTGRFLRFGLSTYATGSTPSTARTLTIHDISLLPKGVPFQRTEGRVWQEPLFINSANTSTTAVTTFTGGFYESDIRSVNAVTVDTTNEVILDGLYTRGSGEQYRFTQGNSRGTIRNAWAKGRNPGLARQAAGWFCIAGSVRKLLIEDTFFMNTGGGIKTVDCHTLVGDPMVSGITLRRIWAKNIDGRRSNGGSGPTDYIRESWPSTHQANSTTGTTKDGVLVGKTVAQFFNLNNTNNTTSESANISVTDVFIENWHDESAVEDNFNFYGAGGTEATPVTLDRICVWGAYPWDFKRGVAGGTPSNQYNFGKIIGESGTGADYYSGTGCLVSDGIWQTNYRRNPNHTILRNSFFLGPGTLFSSQAGVNHKFENIECISSNKTRDGLISIQGYDRSGVEIQLWSYAAQKDASGAVLRDSLGRMIPLNAPDSLDNNVLKPISHTIGVKNCKFITPNVVNTTGKWGYNQGFHTEHVRPGLEEAGTLTSGNTWQKRAATPAEEHDGFYRWMLSVENAGSSFGLR
jgi:hypothetical protein